jgi:conjugal transfer pilus assembly protein TraE
MQLNKLFDSVSGVSERNNLQLYALILISLCCLLMTFSFINKKAIVTVIPPNLNKEADIGSDFASTSYLEAWALNLSLSLGNVTPTSVSFIKKTVEPVLSPIVYQDVIKALERQVEEIRSNHVTLYFEPRRVLREQTSGKIFVHGQSVLETPTGQRERSERSYEFIIEVLNYLPSLTYIDTYPGPPRTIDELDRLKRIESAAKRRSKG